MSVTIDAKSKRVIVDISKMKSKVPRNLRTGLFFVGKKLKSTASKNILKKPRTGRVYRYKGRRHVASRKGESWANRSGRARRGLIYSVRGSMQLNFGNTVDYAKYLEDNLDRKAHLIAIEQNNRNIISILEDHIDKAVKGKSK